VLNRRFMTIWAPETHDERRANTAESISAAERIGDPIALFYAYHRRFDVSIEAADPVEARRCALAEHELAHRVRQPTLLWATTCHEADLAMIDGHLDDAERLAFEAFGIGQASEPDAAACLAGQLRAIRFEQGRIGELVDLLEQAVEANPGIPGFRSVLGIALCELDRLEEARRVMAPSLEADFADLAYDMTWLAVACGWAEVATRVSDRRAARVLTRLLDPWATMISYPGVGVGASVSHHLAELALVEGDIDLADRHHAVAARVHDQLGGAIWIARTQYQAGRLLRERGSPRAAHESFARALDAAERLGMTVVARNASEMLQHVHTREPA
jgi:tetratricopeptide (TPR) repeat protein